MSKYQVCIEGTEFDQEYTLDELLDLGLLDEYDSNIQVRAVDETQWVIARDYPYAQKEKKKSAGFTINEDGSVTRLVGPATQTSNGSTTQSSTSRGASGSTSSDDNDWLLTIIYIIGRIVLYIIGVGIISAIITAIFS